MKHLLHAALLPWRAEGSLSVLAEGAPHGNSWDAASVLLRLLRNGDPHKFHLCFSFAQPGSASEPRTAPRCRPSHTCHHFNIQPLPCSLMLQNPEGREDQRPHVNSPARAPPLRSNVSLPLPSRTHTVGRLNRQCLQKKSVCVCVCGEHVSPCHGGNWQGWGYCLNVKEPLLCRSATFQILDGGGGMENDEHTHTQPHLLFHIPTYLLWPPSTPQRTHRFTFVCETILMFWPSTVKMENILAIRQCILLKTQHDDWK